MVFSRSASVSVADKSQSSPRVLVSVLRYNSAQTTVATLRCLQRQTFPNYDLQLVDNASTDGALDQIRVEFPQLKIFTMPENIGYTGGNNFALAQARAESYDHVIISNHDIEVDERAVACLVETAQTHADAGLIGGVEWNLATDTHRAAGGGSYSKWRSKSRWLLSGAEGTGSLGAVETFCVHGAFVLFTAQAIAARLSLDENLFMYFDEVDLGFQLRARGLRAYVDHRVIIKHKSDPRNYSAQVGYLMQRNRLYMVRKYGRWYHRLFYHLYAPLLELPVKFCVRALQGHGRFARACIAGHWDGLRGRHRRAQGK